MVSKFCISILNGGGLVWNILLFWATGSVGGIYRMSCPCSLCLRPICPICAAHWSERTQIICALTRVALSYTPQPERWPSGFSYPMACGTGTKEVFNGWMLNRMLHWLHNNVLIGSEHSVVVLIWGQGGPWMDVQSRQVYQGILFRLVV